MGGFGSGRGGGWGRWLTTDDVPRSDVRQIARRLWLEPGAWLILHTRGGPPQRLVLEWTQCGFGGVRPWARCPGCGRRVGVLYLRHSRWCCRTCHDLAYASTRMPRVARLIRRASAWRARFGLRRDLLAPLTWLDKPPRMWDRTFSRVLVTAHDTEDRMRLAVWAALGALATSFAGLEGQIRTVPTGQQQPP